MRLESDGQYMRAISYYKRAYKLDPELQFRKARGIEINGKEFDEYGFPIENDPEEEAKIVALLTEGQLSKLGEENNNATSEFPEREPAPLFYEAIIPEPVPHHAPKFRPDDVAALDYLDQHGYVVFHQIATKEETAMAAELFWQHVEEITHNKVQRNKVDSWDDELWIGDLTNGLIGTHGIGQSKFQWYVRGLPTIKQAFATIWKDSSLLTSLDGCGAFRPITGKKRWKTRGGWYHVDQNGYKKKGRHTVQGLFNVYRSHDNDGGLVVVPKSHLLFEHFFTSRPFLCTSDGGDYVMFPKNLRCLGQRDQTTEFVSNQSLFRCR